MGEKTNGFENLAYIGDDYQGIPWADAADETEPTINNLNDDHAAVENIKDSNESEHDSFADKIINNTKHATDNSQTTDHKCVNWVIPSNSTEGVGGEGAADSGGSSPSTFHSIPFQSGFRYVTQLNRRQTSIDSQHDPKKQLGSADVSEVHEIGKRALPESSSVDRKPSWLSRFCTDSAYREHVLESIAVEVVTFIMGGIYGAMGPSLPDLQIISGMGLQEASWIFTGFAIGYMVGCLGSGLVMKLIGPRVILAVASVVAAVAVAILPLFPNGYVMVAMRIAGGVAMGCQQTSQTSRLFAIWGSKGGPWLQMTHFVFAFGGIISPLLIKPFLAPTLVSTAALNSTNVSGINATQEEYHNSSRTTVESILYTNNVMLNESTNSTYESIRVTQSQFEDNNGTSITSMLYINNTVRPYISTISPLDTINSTADSLKITSTETGMRALTVGASNILYAYLIIAIFSFISAIPFIVFYLKDRQRSKTEIQSEQTNTGDTETDSKKLPKNLKYVVLTITCISSSIGTAYIDLFPNYLTSFGILQVGATKEEGSTATAIYFAAYAAGNFLGVIILRYMSSGKFMALSHAAAVLSLIMYYISAVLQLPTLIQLVFVGMCGVSFSSILPTMFTWTQDNVTPISGQIASAYLVAGSLGVMVNPLLLGYLMENTTPLWFMYISFLEEAGGVVLFATSAIIVTLSNRTRRNNTSHMRRENSNEMNSQYQADLGDNTV